MHSDAYHQQRSRLASAVARLKELVDKRTASEVQEARSGLRSLIIVSITCIALTALLLMLAFRTIRRRVLKPIQDMCAVTGQLAQRRYDARIEKRENVEEIETLRRTLNTMARAIENDIHERESIGRELQDARTRAEQATEAKSMFLANMSHEIRTPLNAVIGMAELLLNSKLPPRQYDYADKIRLAGRTLRDTLNDILDFSKIEAGRMALETTPFFLENVIARAFLPVEQSARDKGVELVFEAPPGSAPALEERLLGDPLRLVQILGNLLSNAVKFTAAGHVSLRVSGKESDDGRIALGFTVEDTGIGMSRAQIDQVFDDFVQADSTTTRKYGGTGLGLAITRRLVLAMNGQLHVTSEVERGSTFSITLTLPRADKPGPVAELPPPRVTLAVLIVDDHPETRLALIDLLKLLGVDNVDAVAHLGEALECLEAGRGTGSPYDILMLDWNLPNGEGATILDTISSRPDIAPRHIALLAATVGADDGDMSALPESTRFLDKPILPDALRRLLNTARGLPEVRQRDVGVEAGSLEGMCVLLVDDNPTGRDVAVSLMARWGVEVDTAVDGQDALLQIAKHPPDHYALVLMDLQMPVMDGLEATRRLKAQPRHAALPVYALSAHSGSRIIQTCLSVGMAGCIAKPYEQSDLYAVLRPHYHCGGKPPALQAPASPGEDIPAALRNIPGLDAERALHEIGVSPGLYPQLLEKFRVQFAGGATELSADVAASAWDRVAIGAHTLKGRSGLLGMAGISATAARLETAARARDSARAKTALGTLNTQIQAITASLDQLPSQEEAQGERP